MRELPLQIGRLRQLPRAALHRVSGSRARELGSWRRGVCGPGCLLAVARAAAAGRRSRCSLPAEWLRRGASGSALAATEVWVGLHLTTGALIGVRLYVSQAVSVASSLVAPGCHTVRGARFRDESGCASRRSQRQGDPGAQPTRRRMQFRVLTTSGGGHEKGREGNGTSPSRPPVLNRRN